MERQGNRFSDAALTVSASTAFLFLMLPSVIVVILSFSSAQFLSFPPPGFSLQWYAAYFGDGEWLEATLRSFIVAAMVTVAATVLGTMASLALVRYPIRGATSLYVLLISPLIVPTIVLGISMYSLFAKLQLIGSYLSLVIAHSVLALPFVVMNVTTALHSFDTTLERAANSMGATPFTTFRKVLLPLLKPGIFNGSILAFITSFDEIVITLFLAGARPTLPKKMYDGIQLQVNPTLTAVATIFIVTSAALLVSAALMRRITPGRASNEV
jgi:putative spermidine/putrescine transport system permease protein